MNSMSQSLITRGTVANRTRVIYVATLFLATIVLDRVSRSQEPEHRLEFNAGFFRADKTPEGKVIVELKSERDVGGSKVIHLCADTSVEFTDDGQEFDREAKDGVYTGGVPGDIDAELKRFEILVEHLRKDRLIPIFSGPQLIGHAPGSSFIVKDPDPEVVHRFPVLSMSAGTNILIPNSVAITDLSVIENSDCHFNPFSQVGTPNGAWTFGHLIAELASDAGVTPDVFCRNWLDHWAMDQTINGYTSAANLGFRDTLLGLWPTDQSGNLDMAYAPFRLLGIFNRIDVRRGIGGPSATAGEIRFVYCFTDDNMDPPRSFLVSFEYQINPSRFETAQSWGVRWAELSELQLGSPAYISALERLTREITDVSTGTHAHRLMRVRTNESIGNMGRSRLVGHPWEMREFALSDVGLLVQRSVSKTPDNSQEWSQWLSNLINSTNSPATPRIRSSDEGASSINIGNAYSGGFFWAPLNVRNDGRHLFSLNTCNGCHGRETMTVFTHVQEAPFGTQPQLSGFLTGTTVIDPLSGTARDFNELERRRQDLQNLVDTPYISHFINSRGLTFGP
jgi:hypothetical protein